MSARLLVSWLLTAGVALATEAANPPVLAPPEAETKPAAPEVPAEVAPPPPVKPAATQTATKLPAPPLMSRLLREAVEQTLSYAPKGEPPPVRSSPGDPDPDVVRLPAVTVTDNSDRMNRAIAETFRKKEAEAFNWRDGGRIPLYEGKRVTIELNVKYDPEARGWSIFSISR